MSYAISESLQTAVFARLTADTAVSGLVGTDIYDAVPSGALPTVYIALGEERVRDHSTKTASGALHDIAVDIHSDTAGFQTAKILAGAVCDALIDADLALARGVLTSLNFRVARARKGVSPDQRVINLTFRAFVMDV